MELVNIDHIIAQQARPAKPPLSDLSLVRSFEGIVCNMERRYRETDSNTVREEFARYISRQPCPD